MKPTLERTIQALNDVMEELGLDANTRQLIMWEVLHSIAVGIQEQRSKKINNYAID